MTALVCAASLPYVTGSSVTETLHGLLLLGSYSFMYLVPTLLIAWLLQSWRFVRLITTSLSFTATLIVLFFDGRLHDLYGFHVNGFVWNLLTTPGGFASLGADQTNPLLIFKYVAILLAMVALCYFCAVMCRRTKVKWGRVFALFFVITIGERLMYGFAYANLDGEIMNQADCFMLYQPMTINTLLTRFGYITKKSDRSIALDNHGEINIHYPLADIHLNKIEKPYNVLFLVAESLRDQDIFNERVMPFSVNFAKNHGSNFTQHYSGGNGTRQGLFAFFYGLYGSYWDSFLRAQQAPVLFDVLGQYGYEYFTYTSAHFTYPEFDQTIFRSLSPEKLHETSEGEPWKRDQENVSLLLDDIDQRDSDKPFFGFLFFESTHARYSFPAAGVVEQGYLETLDYAGLSREELKPIIGAMKSRYINASHYVDSQFQRVYEYLIAHDLLENTIVVITGDHGEEFMEKSRWGHNSSFVEEQVRVPMIVSFPGRKPEVITAMTSHLDVSGTVLKALGVSNPATDYTLGQNLFDRPRNEPVVVASWSDLGLITEQGKLVIPFKGTTQHKHLATSKDDVPTDMSDLMVELSSEIGQVITRSQRFMGRETVTQLPL
ncbi:MAG: sulfatase-like hydrolase/transferase [Porticoccus sp.]|nr:sulfatase-like hydrolase/transferase [Porticoccus sp.]